jgi:hypothetical protein
MLEARMNICAYCGSNGPFTREHILPKCLYQRTPHIKFQILEAVPQKIVEGEVTIRDVCASCNNGNLSGLDAYFCDLYDTYFQYFVQKNQTIKFEYDFFRLTRWLLKTSYNSARVHNSDQLLANYKNYILRGEPEPRDIGVFVQLIIPYHYHIRSDPTNYEINPEVTRITTFEYQSNRYKIGLGRMVSINSYYFYIALPPEEIVSDNHWHKTLKELGSTIPGSQWLYHHKSAITLYASNIDARKVLEPYVRHYEQEYRKYKDKRIDKRKS